jgi:hypothetical protein
VKANRFATITPLEWGLALLALLLYFWNYGGWSITNDELSALNRLAYDSFGELIQKGIMPDGHPALMQLFLYAWTAVFGENTWFIRLPSVLFTLGGLYFFYHFARKWFSYPAALLASSTLVFSQFFLNYAQLARPYALGFLGCMLVAYSISHFETEKHKKWAQWALVGGLIISFTAHYFAAFTALLTLLLGFTQIKKKAHKKRYFGLSLLAALVLCLHLPITLKHLKIGGLSWLPQAQDDFLFTFLVNAFNHQLLFLALPLALGFVFLFLQKPSFNFKGSLILLILFITPYAVGHYYSLHYKPILQYSVLLFSLPFGILFFYSFVPENFSIKKVRLGMLLLTVIGFGSLYQSKRFFGSRPFANFKEVIAASLDYTKAHTDQEVLAFANNNDSSYFDYYYRQFGAKSPFDLGQFRETNDLKRAGILLNTKEAQEVLLAFAGVPIPLEVYELAKTTYPEVKVQKRYFNSEFLVLGKSDKKRATYFEASWAESERWEFNEDQWLDTSIQGKVRPYKIESNSLYSFTYKNKLGKLSTTEHPWLCISLKAKSEAASNFKIVVDVSREGETIFWRSFDSQTFYQENQWYQVLYVWTREQTLKDEDEIKIYLWNPDKSEFYLHDLKVVNYLDSDYRFYEIN